MPARAALPLTTHLSVNAIALLGKLFIHSLPFLLVFSASSSAFFVSAERVAIKIIEGGGTSYTLGSSPYSAGYHNLMTPKPPALSRAPHPVSGPTELANLAGRCFERLTAVYRYRFCPFQNVTQRAVTGGSAYAASLWVIIGIWGEWQVEGDTIAMVFTDGTRCGSGVTRRVKVALQCGAAVEVSEVEEPSPCVYETTLTLPEACGLSAASVAALSSPSLSHEASSPPSAADGADSAGQMQRLQQELVSARTRAERMEHCIVALLRRLLPSPTASWTTSANDAVTVREDEALESQQPSAASATRGAPSAAGVPAACAEFQSLLPAVAPEHSDEEL